MDTSGNVIKNVKIFRDYFKPSGSKEHNQKITMQHDYNPLA